MTVQQFFPTPLQQFQFYDKYSRWIPEFQRREEWPETVDRVMRFFRDNAKVHFESYEWLEMESAILHLEAMPSMRVIQMAGPALERDNTGVYNCAYTTIDRLEAIPELLYVLMQGTGIGYSVEDHYVSRLPRIRKQRKQSALPVKHVIADSTEGWCDAVKCGLELWYDGYDVVFDDSQVRPAGTVLKIKGGRASGPQPLKDLLAFIRATVLERQGKKLTPLNAHDIACYAGHIVHVGGVRRAAEISLSDFEDSDIAECKNGEFWRRFPYRAMANNSAVYEERPSATDFMQEWLNLAKSGTGERGIFNRMCAIPARRKRVLFGMNPCGEILLRPDQFCNLSIAIARPDDNLESLKRKVRLATMFGTMQSTLTYFPYLNPRWKENCEEERLLGVDITGQRDCHLFNGAGSSVVFAQLREYAVQINRELAARWEINQSAAVTCVKPSGNSSQFFDCSSGLHARYAPYYIRRVRSGVHNPVARMLKDAGVPCFPETGQDSGNPTVLVFEFPVKSPSDAVCRQDVSALDQFDYWLDAKTNYTEHNPSCSIYVKDDEWFSLGARVYENWKKIGGLSFFPKDEHLYPLAPYEEITKEAYEQRMQSFPDIDWSKLVEYEKEDHTEIATDYACVSGKCEL